MKTTEEVKPLPEHIENYINRSVTFNRFGLINLSVLRSSINTTLSDAELIKRINKRFAHEMVNNQIGFIGYDKYQLREIKEHGDSHFEIFDTDTDKVISDNFLSKNIPSGWGKVKNQFIKSRKKYEFVLSHKNGVFFTKHLNENNKNKK